VNFGGSYGGLEVGVMEVLEREVKLKEVCVEEQGRRREYFW